MGHILGPRSHLSIATLVRLLLGMTMEIWDRECGPFRPMFAVFVILSPVAKTVSPWGKGPGRVGVRMPVADVQGSIAQEFRICSSSLARVMQLTVRATLPNFPFLADLCPFA